MKKHELINFRENPFVWLLLLYFSIVGLALFIGRFLLWDEAIQVFEFFFSPDRQIEKNGVAFLKQLSLPFSIFHAGLGIIGWILFFSKPKLGDLEFVHFEDNEHTRFNLLIISSLLSAYLFGLFNLSEFVIGLRLPIYKEDSIFEYFTAVSFIISGFLFLISAHYVWRDTKTRHKVILILLFLFLALVFILIGGEEISWGQRIFGWETPKYFSIRNRQGETNIHNFIPRLELFEWVAGIIFSVILFGGWLGIKKSHHERLFMIFPPSEMFISALIMVGSSGYNNELFEEIASVFILLYSIWIWNRWKNRTRTSN